jgi:N4-(beta-N-acetylglucosaminyl)-L-asparaginase
MLNRRKFIEAAAIGIVSVSTNKVLGSTLLKAPPAPRLPIVVSTWEFGVAANLAAWENPEQRRPRIRRC